MISAIDDPLKKNENFQRWRSVISIEEPSYFSPSGDSECSLSYGALLRGSLNTFLAPLCEGISARILRLSVVS